MADHISITSTVDTGTPNSATEFRGLETRSVHAWFGKHHALADVSLTFPERTVTGLIGPSGCGKSTFIRLLNRMHEFIPSAAMAGSVLLNGRDIYDASEDPAMIRLKVGMVFQKPNPFPAMTIRENVLAGIKLAHLKKSDHDGIVEQCLTRAGLWKEVKDRLGASGGSLSGGQQQRVAIARSLVNNPYFILADEATGNLDSVTTEEILAIFQKLNDEGRTIIMVTHEDEVSAHAKRVIRLKDGQIQSDLINQNRVVFSAERLAKVAYNSEEHQESPARELAS